MWASTSKPTRGDEGTANYRAHVGQQPTPVWLDTDGLHGYLLGKPAVSHGDHQRASRQYRTLVAQAADSDSTFWQQGLRGQVFPGDAEFAQHMQALAQPGRHATKEIPKAQRYVQRTWAQCLAQCAGDRNRAMLMGYRESGLTMTALAQNAGLSVSHVSRVIARLEGAGEGKGKT